MFAVAANSSTVDALKRAYQFYDKGHELILIVKMDAPQLLPMRSIDMDMGAIPIWGDRFNVS